jgi:hypothetical protein
MSRKYDVATVLERETKTTIADWYALVEAEPDLTAIPLSRNDRCMHLPEMFSDLVFRLRNPLPLGSHALVSPAAKNHGCLRRDQGYTAAMLVAESRMLQVSIFQTLQLHVGHKGWSTAPARNGNRRRGGLTTGSSNEELYLRGEARCCTHRGANLLLLS